MTEFSLFYPLYIEYTTKTLTDETINDLSLDYICNQLSDDIYEKNTIKKIMTEITDNQQVIKYRCDVFDDFLKFPKLREELSKLLEKLEDLKEIERFQKDTDDKSFWTLINRLREINQYVDCITAIKNTLENIDIKSKGLIELKEIVTKIHNDSGFPQLKKDITETLEKARKVKSITIGVNLDDLLRPKNAGIISLNDTEFGRAGLFQNFKNFTDNNDDIHNGIDDIEKMKNFHPSSPKNGRFVMGGIQVASNNNVHIETNEVTGADPLSDALKKAVTDILKRTYKDIKSTLKKYVNIGGYALIKLMPEILFYIRWSQLVDKIIATGQPMCKAEILPTSKRECSIKELYNLKLAIKKVNGEDIDIISNDIEFNDQRRIFILTGPNRGGKTTFTQAVGLVMLLAQCGIYIPASMGKISPCDNIYTHFPADENDTVDLGRLGEESKRLSDIFNVATNNSFLLLNESLATTNVSEGLYIAKDVVKSMRYLGTRAIFNTHMHDLARNLDDLNNTTEGDSKVVSMVTGVMEGKRSFKVTIAPPQGVSYAKDIAETYGVTFNQLKNSIDSKKN